MKLNKLIIVLCLFILTFGVGFSLVSAQTSTDSAETSDSVRDKVQDKINEIKSNPKAFMGSITDITGNSIQIRNDEGLIEQISVSDNSTFAKLSDEAEDMEYDDIAIGDYIIAMGFLDESNVLQSSRVLVTATPADLTRMSAKGVVENLESGDFTLQTGYGSSFEVITTRFTDIFIISDTDSVEGEVLDIEEGDEIIVVGELEEEFEAYHIQITKKAVLPLSGNEETDLNEQ